MYRIHAAYSPGCLQKWFIMNSFLRAYSTLRYFGIWTGTGNFKFYYLNNNTKTYTAYLLCCKIVYCNSHSNIAIKCKFYVVTRILIRFIFSFLFIILITIRFFLDSEKYSLLNSCSTVFCSSFYQSYWSKIVGHSLNSEQLARSVLRPYLLSGYHTWYLFMNIHNGSLAYLCSQCQGWTIVCQKVKVIWPSHYMNEPLI